MPTHERQGQQFRVWAHLAALEPTVDAIDRHTIGSDHLTIVELQGALIDRDEDPPDDATVVFVVEHRSEVDEFHAADACLLGELASRRRLPGFPNPAIPPKARSQNDG